MAALSPTAKLDYDRDVRSPGAVQPPAPAPSLEYELAELCAAMELLGTEVGTFCNVLGPLSHPNKEDGPVPPDTAEALPAVLERIRNVRLHAGYLQGVLMSARYRLAL